MLLAAAKPDPFYRTSADALWGDGIRPAIMTTTQLAAEMRKGTTTYRKLYPPHDEGLFGTPVGWIMLAAVGVGAVAIASGGVTAGAGVTSAASSAGTAATSSAVSSGLTAAKSLATAQKIAAGLKISGKVGSVAGVELPDQLMQAADFVANPTGAATKLAMGIAIDQLQSQHNLTLNAKGQDALHEQVKREQLRQGALLRRQANSARQAGYAAPKVDWLKVLPLVIPFAILLISRQT